MLTDTVTNSRSIWKQNDLVLFLGAGASFDSGLPLGDGGAKQIIEEILRSLQIEVGRDHWPQKWPRFEVVVDILEQYIPRSALAIVKCFAGIGLGATHTALARLSQEGWVFLTTNFDDQCERAHREIGKDLQVIRNRSRMHEMAVRNPAEPLLVKLHGDGEVSVDDAYADLGATIRQILSTFSRPTVDWLRSLVRGKKVVFIGYSARDPDLLPLIESIIQAASSVTWIGVTEHSDLKKTNPDQCRRFESLLGSAWERKYVAGGAQNVLEGELQERIAPVKPDERETNLHRWIAKLRECLQACDKADLGLALAAICQFQHHDDLVAEILKCVPNRGVLDSKRLEIECKHLCRIGHAKEAGGLAASYQTKLGALPIDERLRAACTMSLAIHNAGQFQEAMKLLQCVIPDAEKEGTRPNLARAIARLGLEEAYTGGEPNLLSARNHLREAVKMSQGLKDKVLEAEARRALAIGLPLGARMPSDYDDALREANEVLALQREMGDPRGVMDAQNIIASLLWKSWNAPMALKLFEEVWHSADALGDKEVLVRATVNRALCHIALDEDPISTADSLLREAVQMCEANPLDSALGSSLLHRGYARLCCCEWVEAVGYLLQAANAYVNAGAMEGAGYAFVLTAWAQLRSGNVEDAMATLERIYREHLIPQGEYHADFEMLEFAFKRNLLLDDQDSLIEDVEEKFAKDPEQRFQLLLFIFEKNCQQANRISLERIVASLSSAAKETRYKVFEIVLERAVKSGFAPTRGDASPY
jgi:tetratricopeptide (TPR) repeat protein